VPFPADVVGAEADRKLGRLYARNGRTAEARGALKRALVLDASRAEVETMLRTFERSAPSPGRGP